MKYDLIFQLILQLDDQDQDTTILIKSQNLITESNLNHET